MGGTLALLKHEKKVGPGWLLDCCVDRCDFFRVVHVRSPSDLMPPETCAGVVLAGPPLDPGLFAAKDPLLRAELVFVRTLVGLGVNYLGIGCGAQVLAWALRGKVLDEMDDRLGQDQVELTDEGRGDGLFGAVKGKLPVVRMPTPRLVLPPPAVVLAGTEELPDVFRTSPTVYGVVHHIETTPLMLKEQIEASPELDRRDDADPAVTAVEEAHGEQRSAAWDVMDRLIARARDFCPEKPLVSPTDEPIIPL